MNPVTVRIQGSFSNIASPDLGLRSLQKCQKLKRITMNKIITQSSAISYQGISLAGIQALVVSLPKLEFINFGSMGKALKFNRLTPKQPLKLNYISEMDPKFVDIKQLETICPLIQHLNLSVPISINSRGFINSSIGVCNEIMAAMAASSLPIKVVELQHFPFSEEFRQFLQKRGKHLEELLLRANGAAELRAYQIHWRVLSQIAKAPCQGSGNGRVSIWI